MKQTVRKVLKIIGIVLLSALILAVCALPAVFMNSVYGYFPALVLVFLVVVSFAGMQIMRKGITVSAGTGNLLCRRGRSVEVGLQLVNATVLACPKATAVMRISNLFGDTDTRQDICFSIAAKEHVDFGFGLDMNHVGVYSVGLEEVRIYDFLGIFRCTLPVKSSFRAVVLPSEKLLEDSHDFEEVLAESQTDTRMTAVGGTDYTGVREYVPGDPMKQIHWKLSAHSRGYLTKLQESSRMQEFGVAIDFATRESGGSEELMDINDALIETAMAIVRQIKRTDSTCSLLFTDRSGNIRRTARHSDEDLPDLLRSFAVIKEDPDTSFPDAAQILRQENGRANRSTNIIVVTSRVTRDLIEELETAKRFRRAPELYDIVPAEWNDRQLEDEERLLRELEEASIPCTVVRTAPAAAENGGDAG